MMRRIGLTGGIGSGKTSVSELFRALGAAIIDADEISHQITQPDRPATHLIEQQWGKTILAEDGQLDRIKLRKKVFSNPQQLKILESILHPAIEQKILQKTAHFQSIGEDYCLIVVPLLFEKDLMHLVNQVVVVDLPEDLQIERVMQRDNVNRNHVEDILQQQISRKQRLNQADHVINNTNSEKHLRKRVAELHRLFSSPVD